MFTQSHFLYGAVLSITIRFVRLNLPHRRYEKVNRHSRDDELKQGWKMIADRWGSHFFFVCVCV